MVIDALRMDFVKPPNGKMNYINKLMESNEACLINIHVQTPTVTLPRIKVEFLNIYLTIYILFNIYLVFICFINTNLV